jgi:hypothetical protein
LDVDVANDPSSFRFGRAVLLFIGYARPAT